MLLENALEYIEIYYVNIKEVSFLAVCKIYNLLKNKKGILFKIRNSKSYILFSKFAK